MIEVEKLSKSYGQKLAVDDVSFKVGRGEVLAFIGPNGAGKSTTMRILTGFIPANGGRVTIDSFDVEKTPLETKRRLGYLPENAPLYSNMTVTGFLNFAAEIRGFSGAERKKKVDAAIKTCFLEPVRHQSIDTLSKGYRHRTCFAQAILHDPDFLILDEPTDGLDPNQKREVRNLIKSMGQSKAIIISTHILEEVEAVASRVILIDCGRKVFDGSPDELRGKDAANGSVVLEIFGEKVKDVSASLENLGPVDKVEILKENEQSVAISIRPNANADPSAFRKAIFAMVKDKDWDVGDFKVEKGRLDAVFHDLTLSDDQQGGSK